MARLTRPKPKTVQFELSDDIWQAYLRDATTSKDKDAHTLKLKHWCPEQIRDARRKRSSR